MRISYLGPTGTFSEEAAHRYYSSTHKNNIKWFMYNSIIEVIESVGEGDIDQCIVPIENSIEGTINVTVDAMVSYQLRIIGEIVLPVHLHLLSKKDSRLDDIVEVRSINPALAQCREFIKRMKVASTQYESTSSAAASLKEEGRLDIAAIASEWTAKQYDLQILARDIQDNLENHTKFVILTRESKPVEFVGSKVMLLIQPGEDRAGLLSSILNVFSTLSINLTWIESRPTKKKLGTYQFFIEAQIENEASIIKAINILNTLEHKVHVFGSYDSTRL